METVHNLLSKFLVSDPDSNSIEWTAFCRLLQKLDPATYTSDYLHTVFLLLKNDIESSSLSSSERGGLGALNLDELLRWIFRDGIAVSQQPVLRKQNSITTVVQETTISAVQKKPNTLKRQKTGELDCPEPNALIVRTISGEEVCCLRGDEIPGLSVLQLRDKVGQAANRCIDEVKLVLNLRTLEDDEAVETLIAGGTPCEVLFVTHQLPQFDPEKPAMQQLDVLKGLLMAISADYRITGARHIRKILSIEHNPPIDEVVSLGIAPRLLELSQDTSSPKLQLESMWALTNIASGTSQQTQVLVDLGAVPVFVKLLETPDDDRELQEQTVWAIGNVAGDSPLMRDLCLANGALMPIVKTIESAGAVSLLRNATWSLSNLCRGKPPPALSAITPALKTLTALLHFTDIEVLTDTCWALSYILDTSGGIEVGIDAGVCPRLVELLLHESPAVVTPALRAVGNIATGDDKQTQTLLDCNVLPALKILVAHTKKSIRKETCWTLSNILGGTPSQIEAVISAGLIPIILDVLNNHTAAEADVAREAAWCIANACSSHKIDHVQHVVESGGMPPLVHLLDHPDEKILTLAIDAIETLLNTSTGVEPCHHTVKSSLNVGQLQMLKDHPNEHVSQKVLSILSGYFWDVGTEQLGTEPCDTSSVRTDE